MRRFSLPFATAFLAMLLTPVIGCEGKPSEDEASIQARLKEKGTADLMDQVAKSPEFQPPPDGRLTGGQVEMYLEVQRREQKIREVAFKNLADVATADLRAAQELGYNPKEYSWVKERVLEARMLQTAKALDQQLAQGRQAVLAMLKERRRTALDDAQRNEIDQQIAEIERSAAAAGGDPAKESNAALIARYQDGFAKLQAEAQRISEELQKSSGSQGGQHGQ